MSEKEIKKIMRDAYFDYRKKLISEIYPYTHDYDLAEDCVQDAFCVLYTKLCDGQEKIDDLHYFMLSVAKNYALIYLDWHSGEVCIEDVPSAENALLDNHLDAQMLEMENREIVHCGMAKLSPLYRKIINMRYLNGLNYSEIGREVGMSSEAVRKGLARVQKQIKNEMIDDERGEIKVCLLMKIPAIIF